MNLRIKYPFLLINFKFKCSNQKDSKFLILNFGDIQQIKEKLQFQMMIHLLHQISMPIITRKVVFSLK